MAKQQTNFGGGGQQGQRPNTMNNRNQNTGFNNQRNFQQNSFSGMGQKQQGNFQQNANRGGGMGQQGFGNQNTFQKPNSFRQAGQGFNNQGNMNQGNMNQGFGGQQRNPRGSSSFQQNRSQSPNQAGGNNPAQGSGWGGAAGPKRFQMNQGQGNQMNQGGQGNEMGTQGNFGNSFANNTGFNQKPTNAQARGGSTFGQKQGFGGNKMNQNTGQSGSFFQQQQQQQSGGFFQKQMQQQQQPNNTFQRQNRAQNFGNQNQGGQNTFQQGNQNQGGGRSFNAAGGPGGAKSFAIRRTPQKSFNNNQGNFGMSAETSQDQSNFGQQSSRASTSFSPHQNKSFNQDDSGFGSGMRGQRGGRFQRGQRGGDRGGDRGSRGMTRGMTRGTSRGSFRGGDRGSSRGSSRGDRGSSRGVPRGSSRGSRGGRGGFNTERSYREKRENEEEYSPQEEDYSEEEEAEDYDDEEDDQGSYYDEDEEEDDYSQDERDYDDDERDDRRSSPAKSRGGDLRNKISGADKPSITSRIVLKGDRGTDADSKPQSRPAPPSIQNAKPQGWGGLGSKMTNGDRKRLIAKYGDVTEQELEDLFAKEQAQGGLDGPKPAAPKKLESSPEAPRKREKPYEINKTFLNNVMNIRPTKPQASETQAPPPPKEVVQTPNLKITRQLSHQTESNVQSLKEKLKKARQGSKQPQIETEDFSTDLVEKFRRILNNGIKREQELILGQCQTMCPMTGNHSSDLFERERGTERSRPDWFVKKYERAAADRDFTDEKSLRPPAVLRETMDYLIFNIIDVDKKKNAPYALPKGRDYYRFDDIHNFVWGAMRSIKQDISVQRCDTDRFTIELLEEIARYYILAINEGRDPEIKQFDAKLNMDQLTDTLTSLRLSYKASRNIAFQAYHLLKDQPGFNVKVLNQFEDIFYLSPNEAEFAAYDLIVQLENEKNYIDIHQRICLLSNEVLASKEVKFATRVISAVKENNYKQYFKLLDQADYLTSCIMYTLIKKIREKALEVMRRSQRRSNIEVITVDKFYELLSFEDLQEAETYLRLYGLEEVPQEMERDDRIGAEGTAFRLQKIKYNDDEERINAVKRYAALKPVMNTRIIEAKRDIENFKGIYQHEKDIHFNNTQVPRKFLIKGQWKTFDKKFYLKALISMLNLPLAVFRETVSVKPGAVQEQAEVEEEEEVEVPKKTELFAKPAEKSAMSALTKQAPAAEEEGSGGLLALKRKTSEVVPKEQLLSKPAAEAVDAKSASQKEAEEKRKAQAEKERKEQERLAKENEARRKAEAEERKRLQAKREKAALNLFKVLGTTLEKNQKELLQHFEAALDYDREVKEFRKAILTNKFEYGLNSMKLKGLPPTTDLYLMEEESTYKFFNFLVESFSTKEPELDKYCFKASLFYPLKKDFHFELFKILLQFLTDNQESLEQLDFDQFPTLYENKNIEFSSGDQTKQLCVSYKLYDESYRIQSKTEIEQESDSVIDSANINFVLPNEVLSSNVILFVLTGKNKTDRQRFEPIFNAINNRQSIEKVSVVFMQLIETKQDKSKRRLKKDEMIQLFSLEELYEKGLRPYFIRIPYTEVTEQANGHFYFKGIDHFLQDKFTTIVNQSLQDKISVKLPSFFTLKDLAEKVRNSLEDLDNLEIDYESSGMEVKAKLFHEMMSTNSIESYFYVKNFLNHAVESIKLNFDYWYHNLDEIPQEFLENFNQKAFDKIKNAKQEFDEILEVMFKFNDFDEKYTQKIRAKVTKPFNSSLVYELISRKIQKVFMSRKREFNLQELSDFLLTDFKYNSALGKFLFWELFTKNFFFRCWRKLEGIIQTCL